MCTWEKLLKSPQHFCVQYNPHKHPHPKSELTTAQKKPKYYATHATIHSLDLQTKEKKTVIN